MSMHVVAAAVILVGGAGSNVDLRAGNGGASCIGMSESEPLEDELDESDELAFELLIMLDIDGSSWFRTCLHDPLSAFRGSAVLRVLAIL
jgi:hypothetical protein